MKTTDQNPIQRDMFTRMKGEMGIQPKHHRDDCRGCGTCAASCPRGIITEDGQFVTRAARKRCLGCPSCAKNCPHDARRFEPSAIQAFMGGVTLKPLVDVRMPATYGLGDAI